MTFTESDFVPVTTWSRHRRHWALASEMKPFREGGLAAATGLCAYSTGGLDQEAATAEARACRLNDARCATAVADLPGCKFCDKAKARRLAEVTT